jgi:hypothetical protein
MFALHKWYLDVVTDEGDTLVTYAARLRWRQLRLSYAAVLHSPPSGPAREASSFGRVGRPQLEDDLLIWEHAPLHLCGRWRRTSPAVRRTLLRTGDGAIRWTCHQPSARATVECEGRTLDGVGYVECLSLTIPPWKLPFRTLCWGRHASDRHAVVWIDWSGRDGRQFIWLDGVEQLGARLDGASVRGLADGAELQVRWLRDICRRPALARLSDHLPIGIQRLMTPLHGMREHKQLARSAIIRNGTPLDRGWTVFEEVAW